MLVDGSAHTTTRSLSPVDPGVILQSLLPWLTLKLQTYKEIRTALDSQPA